MGLADVLNLKFIQEVIACTKTVEVICPQTDVAIELGGEDAKITFFGATIDQRMNGTCAGGTGAFIDQMASLLDTDPKGLDELARGYKMIYPIAARCGVFAKTDIQPLINDGARHEDIAASIFQAVVNQTVSVLACGHPIRGYVAFLGGPLQYLSELRHRFYLTLNLDEAHRIVPQNAHLFVASGAAMAHESNKLSTFPQLIQAIDALGDTQGAEVERLDPLFATDEDFSEFKNRHDTEVVPKGKLDGYTGRVFIGIDAGSTTMKAAVVGEDGELLLDVDGMPVPKRKAAKQIVTTVHVTKATKAAIIFEDVDTGLSLYPIAWGNWEKQKNQYHGRALVTGLIPNQIFINSMFATAMRHLQLMAFPKTVYNADLIAKWDPFNAVIVTEYAGTLRFNDVIEGITYRAETDEATGLTEKIITDSKDKSKVPTCDVLDKNGEIIGTYNFPVGGHVVCEDGQTVKTGTTLVKIPRAAGSAGDITGGLPRVTELFEARNPSNPAVVSEIDGEVTMGKVKRGNREIIVTSKTGDQRKYLVSLSKQILVQEHDAVRAGTPLSDGVITPGDILAIKGPTAVQEYIVNEVQDVYRLQGVKINDKHFEIIVRQMMRKVQIDEPGDTTFLEQEMVDKLDFAEENDRIWGKKYVTDAGDSDVLKVGQIVSARKLRDENSSLKRRDLKLVQVRDAVPATSTQVLQGITRAALGTKSFMSAASFQETTKVLNEAAIRGKVDHLEGMKENVICGHLIPAGTGLRRWEKIIVGSREEYDRMEANKKNVLDFANQAEEQ